MIERRDRRNHPAERHAGGENLALLALRGDIAGIGLAVVLDGELARERIDVVGAAGFVERILPAQTRLCRDDARELLLAVAQELGGAQQDLLALIARELRLERLGLGESLAHMLGPRRRHGADDGAVIGISHLDALVGVHPLARDPHRFGAEFGHRFRLDIHGRLLS